MFVGIRDTAVVTQIGVIPELPEEVTAVYNTGLEKQVKVTWEAVSEGMVSEEGQCDYRRHSGGIIL